MIKNRDIKTIRDNSDLEMYGDEYNNSTTKDKEIKNNKIKNNKNGSLSEQGFELISASELNKNYGLKNNTFAKKKKNDDMPDIIIHDPKINKAKNLNMENLKKVQKENKNLEESLYASNDSTINNFFKKKPGADDGLKFLAEKNRNSQIKDIFNGFSNYNDKNVPVVN